MPHKGPFPLLEKGREFRNFLPKKKFLSLFLSFAHKNPKTSHKQKRLENEKLTSEYCWPIIIYYTLECYNIKDKNKSWAAATLKKKIPKN